MKHHNTEQKLTRDISSSLYGPINLIGASLWNITSILPSIAFGGIASLRLSLFTSIDLIDEIYAKEYKKAALDLFLMFSTPFIATMAGFVDFFRFEAAAIHNIWDINFFGYTPPLHDEEIPRWLENGRMFVTQNKVIDSWCNYITDDQLGENSRIIPSPY